jgi:plastocyanin
LSYAEKFYIAGGILAVSAVAVSFIGLKAERFPGRMGVPVALGFLVLIGVAATFSVQNGQEESEHRAHELEQANSEIEHEEEQAPAEAPAAATGKEATTLKLAASADEIAYDTTELTASAGEVTIEFTNPSALEHDVAIQKDGAEIAKTETISESEESVSTQLEAGEYTFLCTVPGHAEAGMQGTLTVE